jgi:hypothetical protein
MALSGAEHLVVLFVLGLALTLIGLLLKFSAATREGSHTVKDQVRSVDLGMSLARGGSDRRPRP